MGEADPPLAGRVALVTGASRGIGRAVAEALSANGAHLALVSRSLEGVEKVAEEIRAAVEPERKVLPFACDVASWEEVSRLIEDVLASFDRIDILINNAGVTRDNLLLRMKEEEWDDVLATNLKGTFHTCRIVARQMLRQREGRIINITSVVGLVGNVGQANYAASKGGVIALTYSLAKELASRGVTVNAVAPGFIATDMTAAMTDDARDAVRKSIPLERIGKAEDVAALVAFLSGPGASYITGEVIRVDGGLAVS